MNTRRENRLEELGRVDAEKAYTSKGKKNLRDEKSRIRKELNIGGRAKASPSATRRDFGTGRERLKKVYKPEVVIVPPKRQQSPGRPGGKMTGSEKRNLIKRRSKRIKEGKEIIRKKHKGGGMAQRGLGRAFMKGGKA